MMLLSIAAAAVLALSGGGDEALPRALKAQEEAPPKPNTAPPAPEGGTEFFGPLQVQPHMGVILFSEDFKADPELIAGVSARASLPSISRDLLGLGYDALGAFLDISFSSIERDVPFIEQDSGNLVLVTVGADFAILDDETWTTRLQTGAQFGHFGRADDTDSGFAFLLGLSGGLKIAPQFQVVLSPQVAFGNAGDQIYFIHLGLQIEF